MIYDFYPCLIIVPKKFRQGLWKGLLKILTVEDISILIKHWASISVNWNGPHKKLCNQISRKSDGFS